MSSPRQDAIDAVNALWVPDSVFGMALETEGAVDGLVDGGGRVPRLRLVRWAGGVVIEVSAEIGAKALRLVETGCVRLESMSLATVKGDSGEWHQVTASRHDVHCSCRAWTARRACSHCAAALICWAEKLAAGEGGAVVSSDAGANPPATASGALVDDPPAPEADDFGDAA